LNFSGRELGLDEDVVPEELLLDEEEEEISELNLPSGMFIEENGEMVDVDPIVFEKFDEDVDIEVVDDLLDVVDDEDKF